MKTLSELALKGHFESLRNKFDRSEATTSDDLLAVVGKAVKMAEDIYEHDPDFFSVEHRSDYLFMLDVLNRHGFNYKGHPDLAKGKDSVTAFNKKPMQKAGNKASGQDREKKTG